MYDVAVVKYEKPYESLKKAVELCGGFGDLTPNSKVLIKPNLVIWHEGVNFPKYGVLTTSRMIEDMVRLLKEQGVNDITIGEGVVELKKHSESMMEKAAKGLGLNILSDRYGVKIVDVLKGSFCKIIDDKLKLSVSDYLLEADYVINMPVLKTHSQAVVSLGIKNLKGALNIASRKTCHNADQSIDLQYHIAKFAKIIPNHLTVIDGIYTVERGPLYNGRAYRSNVIVASHDVISADKVGATMLLGQSEPVPHIAIAAEAQGRPTDLTDVNIRGNLDIYSTLKPHKWAFEHNDKSDLPLFFEKTGIKGITYPEADRTICTYCAIFINYIVMGILMAENEDKRFDDIEMLSGKIQKPTPGHKHTLLIGQCQVKLNGKNPLINHCVKIPGCPAKIEDFVKAYEDLGIQLPDNFLDWMEKSPEILHMRKYVDRPEFDPAFYMIN